MGYTFQFGDVFAAWPLWLKGTWITMRLSDMAMTMGLCVAMGCAWGKTSGPAVPRVTLHASIELIRAGMDAIPQGQMEAGFALNLQVRKEGAA